MGTTPALALPYPDPADPADVPTDMHELADRIELILGATPSVSPPASPTNGQEWILPLGNGVNWVFRYNAGSSSGYKWEFLGGPAFYSEAAGDLTIGGTGWTDGGVSISVPRSGDYQASYGFRLTYNASVTMFAGLKLGAAVPADPTVVAITLPQPIGGYQSVAKTDVPLTTAGTIGLAFTCTPVGPVTANRYVSIKPIRVS